MKSGLFFNTYYAVAYLIIISLLTGLIWEVFAFMDKNLTEQAKVNEFLNEINFLSVEKGMFGGGGANRDGDP